MKKYEYILGTMFEYRLKDCSQNNIQNHENGEFINMNNRIKIEFSRKTFETIWTI